jgi:hypothetical protein
VLEEPLQERLPLRPVGRAGVRPLGEVHHLERHALHPRGARAIDRDAVPQGDALLLLHVVVLPAVGEKDRGSEVGGVLAIGALLPEGVVVGAGVVPLLRVPGVLLLARTHAVGDRGLGGLVRGIRSDGPGEAVIEQEGRVEALVGRLLGVQEESDAIVVRVAVPVADRGHRDDGLELGNLRAAGGDHVRGGSLVRAADHGHLAARPRLTGQELHHVDARLLLLGAAVVPAAGGSARTEHVGNRAGVALGDEVGSQAVLAGRVLEDATVVEVVVGRVGQDDRDLLEVGVSRDLDVDRRAVDGGDVVLLRDHVRREDRGGRKDRGHDGRGQEDPGDQASVHA